VLESWRVGGCRVGGSEGWRVGGCRVGGLEGWRLEGWRVEGLEGWRVCGFVGLRVCGFAGLQVCRLEVYELEVCGFAGCRLEIWRFGGLDDLQVGGWRVGIYSLHSLFPRAFIYYVPCCVLLCIYFTSARVRVLYQPDQFEYVTVFSEFW